MRQAYQQGYITASLFSPKPTLLKVDQVLFLKPVDVGNIMKLSSKVTYSDNEHIRVVTQTHLENGEHANNFNFVFKAPSNKMVVHPVKSGA